MSANRDSAPKASRYFGRKKCVEFQEVPVMFGSSEPVLAGNVAKEKGACLGPLAHSGSRLV